MVEMPPLGQDISESAAGSQDSQLRDTVETVEQRGAVDAPLPVLPVVVVMGVSGSGKSTVGALLAGRLGWDFEEGDDLHPAANIEKMTAGHPLEDDDRWPWLSRVAAWIRRHTDAGQPGVITCSALRKSYRDILRGDRVVFVYLEASRDEIAHRLAARHGHFMPPELLDSQLSTLEPPTPDEQAIIVNAAASVSAVVEEILARLRLAPRTRNPVRS